MANVITNPTTFNQSAEPGWYTRMLFSNCGSTDSGQYANPLSLFEYYKEGASGGLYSKGNNIFPAGYWVGTEGRVIRLKGCFLFSGQYNLYFDVKTMFSDIGTLYPFVAYPNDNNHHYFANEQTKNDVPVFFEFNLIHGQSGYFTWTGYYKYEFLDYDNGGANKVKAFVPVVKQSTAFQTGVWDTTETFVEIQVSQGYVQLQYMTMEEIG